MQDKSNLLEWYLTEDHSLPTDFIIPDLQEALQLALALKMLPEEDVFRDEVATSLAVLCAEGLTITQIKGVIAPTLTKIDSYFFSQYSLLSKSLLT